MQGAESGKTLECETNDPLLSPINVLEPRKETDGQKSYECTKCPEAFEKQSFLMMHDEEVHLCSGIKSVETPQCTNKVWEFEDNGHSNKFSEPSFPIDVSEMRQGEYSNKLYCCSRCPDVFISPSSLLAHNRRVHVEPKVNKILLNLLSSKYV